MTEFYGSRRYLGEIKVLTRPEYRQINIKFYRYLLDHV